MNFLSKKLNQKFISSALYAITGVLLFIFLLNKAENTYNPYVKGDYHSSLFADPGGYNVYLPGIFNGWFFGKVPAKADSIVGNGFIITENKKIITKYPYGVSLLQSPFYLGGKVYGKIAHRKFTGNNKLNQQIVDWAGIFYFTIGVLLLFNFLKNISNYFIAIVSVVILTFGTNVYYYTVTAAGYSHIYSFFLFICLIIVSQQFFRGPTLRKALLLGFLCIAIILVRPLNTIVLPIILFLGINDKSEIFQRIKLLFTIKYLVPLVSIAVIFIIPQIMYYKWAFGSLLPDTYENEGFTYLSHPKLKEVLFAPLSGLLTYAPVTFLLFISIIIFCFIKKIEGIAILCIILLIIYLSASWHSYAMGCSFGARVFVEFSVLLIIPFAHVSKRYLTHWISKVLIIALIIYPINVTSSLARNFDVCFFGSSDWDWNEYNYLLHQKTKVIAINGNNYEYNNNDLISEPNNTTNKCFSSANKDYVATIQFPLNKINEVPIRMVGIKVDLKNASDSLNAELAVQIMRNGKQVHYASTFINNKSKDWFPVFFESYFPKDLQLNDELKIFILNKSKTSFYVDNYELKMR